MIEKLTRGQREYHMFIIGVLVGMIVLSLVVAFILGPNISTPIAIVVNFVLIGLNAKQLINDTDRYPIKETQ